MGIKLISELKDFNLSIDFLKGIMKQKRKPE